LLDAAEILELAHLRAHAIGGGREVRSVVLKERLEDRALPLLETEGVHEDGEISGEEVGHEQSAHAATTRLRMHAGGHRAGQSGRDDGSRELGAEGGKDVAVVEADHGHLLAESEHARPLRSRLEGRSLFHIARFSLPISAHEQRSRWESDARFLSGFSAVDGRRHFA